MTRGATLPHRSERCTLHDAPMMYHFCGGDSRGEPLGYCEAWDGTERNGWPTCEWAEGGKP